MINNSIFDQRLILTHAIDFKKIASPSLVKRMEHYFFIVELDQTTYRN
jgi:hypothetical protein